MLQCYPDLSDLCHHARSSASSLEVFLLLPEAYVIWISNINFYSLDSVTLVYFHISLCSLADL